jgi:ABC-type branched-subunit amino acid transport system ATPase component
VTAGAAVALTLEAVTVRFGGLIAVSHLSLHAAASTITGLVGPNGAGKSTSFDAVTGAVPSSGTIRLGEVDLHGRAGWQRAQAGLGRTFQRTRTFGTMSVRDNIAIGPEMLDAGHGLLRPFAGGRRRRHYLALADEALERCGLTDVAGTAAAELSTGKTRLVELARVMACPFRFLLLDEPSSGLDSAETERFCGLLQAIVADGGPGILLVEHDMGLVRQVCEQIYVLDFGKLVCNGPTDEILSSPLVTAVYLGSEGVEEVTG